MVRARVSTLRDTGLVGIPRWSVRVASQGMFTSLIRPGTRRGSSMDSVRGSSSSMDTEIVNYPGEGNTALHGNAREFCSVFDLLGLSGCCAAYEKHKGALQSVATSDRARSHIDCRGKGSPDGAGHFAGYRRQILPRSRECYSRPLLCEMNVVAHFVMFQMKPPDQWL